MVKIWQEYRKYTGLGGFGVAEKADFEVLLGGPSAAAGISPAAGLLPDGNDCFCAPHA
jgi:hypothetical protein